MINFAKLFARFNFQNLLTDLKPGK